MKLYFMIFLAAVVAVFFIYRAGVENGRAKCAAARASIYMENQAKIIKQVDYVNEKILNTGVRDIRRSLREKYTIAE